MASIGEKLKGIFIRSKEDAEKIREQKEVERSEKIFKRATDRDRREKPMSQPAKPVNKIKNIEELVKKTEEKEFNRIFKQEALREAKLRARKRATSKARGGKGSTKLLKIISKGAKQISKGLGQTANTTMDELSGFSSKVDIGQNVTPRFNSGGGRSRLPDELLNNRKRKGRRKKDDYLDFGW